MMDERKFILDGKHALESSVTVVERVERDVPPSPGDTVYVLYRGRVERVHGDEIEVADLIPLKVMEVVRGEGG